MKISFLFTLIIFFLTACSDKDGVNTDNYVLTYNAEKTAIVGEVTISMDSVAKNHIIELSNFTVEIEGCTSLSESSISPDSIRYTPQTLSNTLTLNIQFLQSCDSSTLQLKAKKIDTSILDKKVINHTSDIEYSFTLLEADENSSIFIPIPFINDSNVSISKNLETRSVFVHVFDENNVPIEEGDIKIIYPKEASNGVNIGGFSPTKASIKEGVATFVYTAPSDVQTLVNQGYNSTQFKFYYQDNTSQTATLIISFNPEPNQIIQSDYTLLFAPHDDSLKMQIEGKKPFTLSIVDENSLLIANEKITTISVRLENAAIATLIDAQGNRNSAFTYTGTNAIPISIESNTISGLVSLEVDAKFIDVNGELKEIKNTFEVIIESGPPTAISLSYVGTTQDASRAKFIETYAISVTDKFFNPVNTNPNVSVGAIIGYALQDKNNKESRLFNDVYALGTLSQEVFDLHQIVDLDKTTIDIYNDHLATFGSGYSYPASGAWTFDDFNSTTLMLTPNQFDANTTEGLGYAIGHNFRQDPCIHGREWLGQTKLQNDITALDDKGTAIIELMYDYYLVGKDIVIHANIIGTDNTLGRKLKVGEAQKRTLRGLGLEFRDLDSIETASVSPTTLTRCVWIKGTSEVYRNANFSLTSIKAESCSYFGWNTTPSPVTDCNNNLGRACANFIVAADINSTCSIVIGEPQVNSEFKSTLPDGIIGPPNGGGVLPDPN